MLCVHHGSPSGGGGREPPGTHSECRTGATGSPNESRPRADPGPASGRVSPDPGASTPGTSGLGQSKPPPFRYSFLPPPRAKATPVGLVAVSIKIFQTPHIFKITHIIFGAAVFVFKQIKHKLKPYQNRGTLRRLYGVKAEAFEALKPRTVGAKVSKPHPGQ